MGEHDRRRHQLRRLVAGVAEHQALVAGTLLGGLLARGLARVDALGDVGRLLRDQDVHEHPVGVEHVVVVDVADLADAVAGDLDEIELGLGGDLAADDHDVRLDVGLAGDAAELVLLRGTHRGPRRKSCRRLCRGDLRRRTPKRRCIGCPFRLQKKSPLVAGLARDLDCCRAQRLAEHDAALKSGKSPQLTTLQYLPWSRRLSNRKALGFRSEGKRHERTGPEAPSLVEPFVPPVRTRTTLRPCCARTRSRPARDRRTARGRSTGGSSGCRRAGAKWPPPDAEAAADVHAEPVVLPVEQLARRPRCASASGRARPRRTAESAAPAAHHEVSHQRRDVALRLEARRTRPRQARRTSASSRSPPRSRRRCRSGSARHRSAAWCRSRSRHSDESNELPT